ncbi:MAG: UvrD-helicase domain-containing protein [Chloroflexi bacterium]|nr:UvrD-helicase domain-containing protein [Chloroflexota bacterium]
MTLLSQFHFKGNQEKAVTDSSSAIAVTAGAGSGKTLSLVGRYLHLLEQGYPLRSILAITFTEKAAREMRSRIRNSLSHASQNSPFDFAQGEPSSFILHHSSFDSARIGTIHSLCAEILRAHPAEAGLDPQFEVFEEGLSAALQAEAIESALAWAATDEQSVALFGMFKENELRKILNALMSRRLDVTAESALADFHELPTGGCARQDFSPTEPRQQESNLIERFSVTLNSYLVTHLDSPTWLDSLSVLNSLRSKSPEDKLELARQSVLTQWTETQQARAAQNWDAILASLAALRKAISTQGQKANWDDIETVREAMKVLRDIYDEHLKFLAEKSRFALDEQLAAHLPAVHRLLEQTMLEYQSRKDERQSLDFDDLEGLSAQLLTTHPEVREQIQSELRAVLVDEFQDTNDRQRQIVYALTGFNHQSPITNLQSPVNLFIVGDSKQSIYRFRSADVTVFRQVQADIQTSGGELIDLDLTFRAHKPLLEQLNALLAPILGETDDPARPYAVPFAPLKAYRPNPVRENIQPPFIEFHLGLGDSAEEGRQAAAQALAQRLRELHETEGFNWGDMALLFRSSTAYDVYENALEAAEIPFVTVAGRGFYDRPEIRDLLNILAAIADPSDDLALVGTLRSPAFAIPDAEIYKLRYPNGVTAPAKIFDSLKEQVDRYTSTQGNDVTRNSYHVTDIHPSSFILHPFNILTELHALSSRAPAAAILKRLLDLTHYRAILASDPNGARMIRNVEKLLADAHRSRLVSLTDFLAYVQTLRDVGLREGEAPADSSNTGAVQLMTVHKAKGLEFPLTVLADAAHQSHAHSAHVQLPITNYPITTQHEPRNTPSLLLDLRNDDFHSTAWQLAARLEDDRAEAEDARLLYVAATRAKEKLIVSGHIKQKKDGTFSLSGWLSKFSFLPALGAQAQVEMSTPEHFPINDRIYAAVYPYSQADVPPAPQPDSTSQTESPRESDLLEPLVPASSITEEKLRARESDPPQRVWRIVSTLRAKSPRAPAWLVGRLVHEAIRRWRFDDLENFLKPFALESGLTAEAEIHAAIQESRRMLERLRAHPLFAELNSAERHHEVRYDLPDGRGIMDLLYRTEAGWFIIDFKTDDIRSDAEAQSAIRQNGYNRQVARYAEAIENQLNARTEPSRSVKAKTRLVFLNVNGEIKIYE